MDKTLFCPHSKGIYHSRKESSMKQGHSAKILPLFPNGAPKKKWRLKSSQDEGRLIPFPVFNRKAGYTLYTYLQMLLHQENKHARISPLEYATLEKALCQLKQLLPEPAPETIRKVREQIKDQSKETVAENEKLLWAQPDQPICEFDFHAAYQNFLADIPAEKIIFMKPEYSLPLPRHVPKNLENGEIYFFIILRMFRFQF